ncbi:hypothetical protein DNTS_031848 [Danionella cerebrum]|uniref:HTH OST-type domain-containing protein n=1 Tax=Danionella cerebrum TaxID=2873325 RepID=A0A553MSZ3_9TELE|nr:hypothetical protein DNTS_031848 [Danionella translucida]
MEHRKPVLELKDLPLPPVPHPVQPSALVRALTCLGPLHTPPSTAPGSHVCSSQPAISLSSQVCVSQPGVSVCWRCGAEQRRSDLAPPVAHGGPCCLLPLCTPLCSLSHCGVFSHDTPSSSAPLRSQSLLPVNGPCCWLHRWSQGVPLDSEKVWPKIPPPIPVGNGCGVTPDGLMPITHAHKPEVACVSEAPPPVGVFWDIENCAVPSGRSAGALVGRVTVAHINAMAKNAADDKLRQCLRRFAETHSAPATVVPGVSLLCVDHLPACPPRSSRAVAQALRRLFSSCGGKLVYLNGSSALLRFTSTDAAERARRRMDRQEVLGSRVHITHCPTGSIQNLATRYKSGIEQGHVPNHLSRKLSNSDSVSHEGSELISPGPLDQSRSETSVFRLNSSAVHQDQTLSSVFFPVEPPQSPNSGNTPEPSQWASRVCHTLPCSPLIKPHPQFAPSSISNLLRLTVCNVTRPAPALSNTLLSATGKPAEILAPRSRRRDSPAQSFLVSSPSAFSKLGPQQSISPMMLPQNSWSSHSKSPPCLAEAPLDGFSGGVELQISNLDDRMNCKELQLILRDTFAKHGRVKSVELSGHADQLKASVCMSSLAQAVGAAASLQRFRIGNRRIQITLDTPLTRLSSEIVSILQDAPANSMALYKFTETYERKFGHRILLSDLQRLPQLVCVTERGGGRLVCLLRQSPVGSASVCVEEHDPVCRKHCTQEFSECEFDPDSGYVPFILLSLKELNTQVHSLLQSHEGVVPLLSFPDCYAAEFGPLAVCEEGDQQGSVPLEHLITCVPGVTVATAQNGFKVVKWIHNKPPTNDAEASVWRCRTPVGRPQLLRFSRELVELMQAQPGSVLPLTRLIPAYHHHFAKQCRVSEYGFSKLLELLEAVPHVLQKESNIEHFKESCYREVPILGLGSRRVLTLTHRAQIKRFTQDLLKLLKFQSGGQIKIREFSQAYSSCFSRDWRVEEYGVCDLMDLLSEIPESTITVSQPDAEEDFIISLPCRERSAEECERTRQFAREVVELLRLQPRFRMNFSNFIPAYHHHYSRQCKLAHYGFSKLMELFQAIPDVLQVLECGEERILALSQLECVKALASQLVKLLRSHAHSSFPLERLLAEYSHSFGFSLRLQDYDAHTLPDLLRKLRHVVKVVDSPEGKQVQLINRKSLRALTSQILALMMSLPSERDHLTLEELSERFKQSLGAALDPCEYGFINLEELLRSLPYLIQLLDMGATGEQSANIGVSLTRLYQFARRVRALLHTYHYNQIFLSEFQNAYSKHTGEELQAEQYGYNSLEELLSAIPQVVWIKGHGQKKIIVLKNEMRARNSAVFIDEAPADEDEPRAFWCHPNGTSSPSPLPLDLLCAPLPCSLLSPVLRPQPALSLPGEFEVKHCESVSDLVPSPSKSASEVMASSSKCASDAIPSSSKAASRLTHPDCVPDPMPPGWESSSNWAGESDFSQIQSESVQEANRPPEHTLECKCERLSRKALRSRVKLAANFSIISTMHA